MAITLSTKDFQFAETLKNSAPSGVSVSIKQKLTRSIDAGDTFIVTLDFVREISIGIVAAWLYDLIKKKTCQITQRGRKIKKTKNGIIQGIQEDLDIGHND